MQLRPIPGFPGYHVADDGSIVGKRGTLLKPSPNSDGYPSVQLRLNGREVHKSVHSLVASAWLPPKPSPKHEVAHFDGVKANCAVSNLRWATSKENHADRLRHGRVPRGEEHGSSKLTADDVRGIRHMRSEGRTLTDIGDTFDITFSQVWKILSGWCWSHVQ